VFDCLMYINIPQSLKLLKKEISFKTCYAPSSMMMMMMMTMMMMMMLITNWICGAESFFWSWQFLNQSRNSVPFKEHEGSLTLWETKPKYEHKNM